MPCTNGQQGYDIVATGNFTINSTNIVVNSPDPVGTSPNIQGIKPGLNNDLVCCTILTPADICCTNFVKQVAATVSMEGNTTSGYNVIKFVPTFVVGPKRTKQVRISVVNFETSSKNKECLSCEKNISNYGTMRVPQNIMGGGKDDIEGMVYPTYPNIVTCVGCPPNWSNRLSSEVTWGSQSGPGFDLTAGSGGDQSTIFRITLPKQSTLSCCDDTIKVCIKYSFTDVDCKTCDTIICYKIVNRATITTTANTSIIGLFGDKPINKIAQTSNIDRLYNRSDLRIDPIAKNTSVFSKTHSNINSLYIDVPLVGLEFLNPKKYYAR